MKDKLLQSWRNKTLAVIKRRKNYLSLSFRNKTLAVIKDSAVRGICPVRTFFGQGREGSSDADVRTFWCKKLRIVRNLWCVGTDKGVEPMWTFIEQGVRGSIFCDIVRKFFMDGPLYLDNEISIY